VLLQLFFYNWARKQPEKVKAGLIARVREALGPDFDVATHFTPRYNPWDQRVCLVPDSDLFRALRSGKASVATDRIETFTGTGIRLESGAELEADIVITATGLNLVALGGMSVAVDGREVELSETVGYKGIMFSGIPNAAVAIGYTNASWTLKCDLACEYVCRLLNHMDARGHRSVRPRRPDPSVKLEPFIDLMSGYVMRSIDQFPKQGDHAPWRLHQNYARDVALLKHGAIADDALEFDGAAVQAEPAAPLAA
jgi:cation diffusion facilitator CzcD-associated flavoprotein CzcO